MKTSIHPGTELSELLFRTSDIIQIHSPILDVDTDGPEIAAEEPAVGLLVGRVAHRPPALVVHDDQRAPPGRLADGPVDADGDLGAVARRDRALLLADLLRDRPGNVAEMVLLAEGGGAVGAEGRVRVVSVVGVRGQHVPDRVAG